MRYQLLKEKDEGVLINSTPILQDIHETFKIEFDLPSSNFFVALFKGEDNIEHKAVIKNGRAKIPTPILEKKQTVRLWVVEMLGDEILRTWECWDLKVTSFYQLRQKQWQVCAAEKDILNRLALAAGETAIVKHEHNELKDELKKLAGNFSSQNAEIVKLKEQTEKQNQAILQLAALLDENNVL